MASVLSRPYFTFSGHSPATISDSSTISGAFSFPSDNLSTEDPDNFDARQTRRSPTSSASTSIPVERMSDRQQRPTAMFPSGNGDTESSTAETRKPHSHNGGAGMSQGSEVPARPQQAHVSGGSRRGRRDSDDGSTLGYSSDYDSGGEEAQAYRPEERRSRWRKTFHNCASIGRTCAAPLVNCGKTVVVSSIVTFWLIKESRNK